MDLVCRSSQLRHGADSATGGMLDGMTREPASRSALDAAAEAYTALAAELKRTREVLRAAARSDRRQSSARPSGDTNRVVVATEH